MANEVVISAKTVEEAVRLALDDLMCAEDEVDIEVLAEPAKGLFGLLGARDAKVRVWKKGTSPKPVAAASSDVSYASTDDTEDKTAIFILSVTELMGIESEISKDETEEAVRYTLSGPRMGAVIGRRGETLDALQYLSNIVAGRDRDIPRKRVIVDAEDYRRRREETLVRLATRLADKAKKSGRRVVLEPMNPQERRIIHTTLEKDPAVTSRSEGEDPYRRLVIYPVNRSDRDGERRYDDSYDRGYDRGRSRAGRDDGYEHSSGSYE